MAEASTRTAATGADLHAFIRYRFGMGDRIYGVVDAATDKELAFAAPRRFGQTIHWLFEDGSGEHMLEVAPYLVPIAFRTTYPYNGSGYLDMWAERLGSNAGILLITSADTDALLSHLQGLFHATDDEDHRYFFRFYDPRVLRVYLPTCRGADTREFFGPVRRILCEADSPGGMLACSSERTGVKIDEKPLQPSGASAQQGGRS